MAVACSPLPVVGMGNTGNAVEVDAVSSASLLDLTKTVEFKSAMSYGGEWEDKFESAAYTGDGGFVAAGYTMGDSSDPEWTYHSMSGTSHSFNDALLVKYGREHEVQWTWTKKAAGVSFFTSVDVLSDGRIVAVGRAKHTDASTVVSKKNTTAIYVVVMNQDKSDIKEYYINASGGDWGTSVTATPDGGFAVAGFTCGKEGYISSFDGGSYSEEIKLWENGQNTESKKEDEGFFNGVVIKFNPDCDNVILADFNTAYKILLNIPTSIENTKFARICTPFLIALCYINFYLFPNHYKGKNKGIYFSNILTINKI